VENPRSVQLIKAAAWLIVLGSILATVIIQSDMLKNLYIEKTQGLPLIGKAYAGDDPATELIESTAVVAVNNQGQVDLFVSNIADGAVLENYYIKGPYLVGADRMYVVPEVTFLDANSDGSLELALILDGELFGYAILPSTGRYEYSWESSAAVIAVLTQK
jgi:hypothetical protein